VTAPWAAEAFAPFVKPELVALERKEDQRCD
jgi:hypothetical protein